MLLASPWAAAAAVISLTIHEVSHLIVSRLAGERIDTLELTPFGGVMTYASSPKKGLQGFLVALAGPLSNYMVLLILPVIGRFLPQELMYQLTMSNAAMMLVNLLPAFPLDGGRMVFSIGYYIFGISALARVLTGLGVLAGSIMIVFGLYGAVSLGCLNLSVLFVGFYLVVCAVRSQTELFTENLFALIQERTDAPKRIQRTRVYMVPEDTKLYQLTDVIGSCSSAAFLIKKEKTTALLPEQDVLAAMFSDPQKTVSSLVDEKWGKTEKNASNFQ